MAMITLHKKLNGRILDVGGGGEGVIGRLYISGYRINCKGPESERPSNCSM